jgi:predicted unusual protein kinase regulating ubiquinone biosynthesis (AarF/ABC1/UbiB family)
VSDQDLVTSALRRFARLGGLAGKVGASVLGSEVLSLARSPDGRREHRAENLARNAARVVETLGELKGAAMKVGQMLSLHEGLLPPEVAAVLRALQKEAPHVPAEVMELEIRESLDDFDRLFAELDFEAYAAASIGQVHLGTLRDGRRVAVKIKYPLIDEIIKADLKNLRTLLNTLFRLFSDADFEPVWREVRDRLLEELDYVSEAANMRRMAGLYGRVPEIVIPAVVEEASGRNVLTMEYLEGIPPGEACSPRYSHELRSRWGTVLFEFLLRGLFEHRFLHADPNLANFAFLEDGSVIVYDFGCVKQVPEVLSAGYAGLLLAVIDGRTGDIPRILHAMGVRKKGSAALPVELTSPFVEVFAPIFREAPPYRFGEDEDLYPRLVHLGLGNWTQAVGVRFPEDIVFVDRALAGHFGNLIRLGAEAPWRALAVAYATGVAAVSEVVGTGRRRR